jgi:ribonuclease HI
VLSRVPGRVSSNKAELWAAIMATCSSDANAALWIGSDSACFVDGMPTHVGSRLEPANVSLRQMLAKPERVEWQALAATAQQRQGPVHTVWVPGHTAEYPPNAAADKWANAAAEQPLADVRPCAVPTKEYTAMLAVEVQSPFRRGRVIEGRPRAAIKTLLRGRALGEWRSSRQGALAANPLVDAEVTFGWSADRRAKRTGSSLTLSSQRGHALPNGHATCHGHPLQALPSRVSQRHVPTLWRGA